MAWLAPLRQFAMSLIRDEDGPTAVEYAVMLALIVGVCVGAVGMLAAATRSNFEKSADAINNAMGG